MTRQQVMREFYSAFVRADDLVFDIGAYHGSRTRAFRALGARVIALEPVRESVHTLFARCGRDPGVTIVPRAVGAAEGQAAIRVSHPHRFSSSLSEAYCRAGEACGRYPEHGVTGWPVERQVRVTTLDALITQFGAPSFVKVDVEGYEDQVFAGLTTPVPALSFEFHPHHLEPARRSLDRLAALASWEYNVVISETFQWESPQWRPLSDAATALAPLQHRAEVMNGDIYLRLVTRSHN